jgi:hypothetical protein
MQGNLALKIPRSSKHGGNNVVVELLSHGLSRSPGDCSTDTHDFRSVSGTVDPRQYIFWVNWMHHWVKSGKSGRWGWRRPLPSSVLDGAMKSMWPGAAGKKVAGYLFTQSLCCYNHRVKKKKKRKSPPTGHQCPGGQKASCISDILAKSVLICGHLSLCHDLIFNSHQKQ